MEINADAGESFGRWNLGDQEELFEHIDAVNIACGFHAGDPTTMRRTVEQAMSFQLSLGAHPGYQDLLGFGRRAIPMRPDALTDMVIYQVGAFAGIVRERGGDLRHIKPHGSLYGALCRDSRLTSALGAGLTRAFPGIPVYLAPSAGADALEQAGCTVVRENAVDLDFDDEGMNVIEPEPQWKDPAHVAEQALRIARGHVLTTTGATVPMRIRSMCVHGDRANAPEIAAEVRRTLVNADFPVHALFPADGVRP